MIRYDRHQNEDDLKRLQIEAEALARLNHPNILGIYEIGKANGFPFVALELLEGRYAQGPPRGKPAAGARRGSALVDAGFCGRRRSPRKHLASRSQAFERVVRQ